MPSYKPVYTKNGKLIGYATKTQMTKIKKSKKGTYRNHWSYMRPLPAKHHKTLIGKRRKKK